jgi:pimeloyl-ACP methyl ester carboxylesterase
MKVREGFATSADGTRIKYSVVGRGRRTWISTPAMGAPFVAMSRLYELLEDTLTIVTWDPRGFFGSSPLAREGAIGVEDHLADLDAVRRAVGVERYLSGGWSMGVPVSLEHARTAGGGLEGLILIAGPHERALAPVIPFARAEGAVLAALDGARALRRPMNLASRVLGGAPGLGKALRAVGLVADNEAFFQQIVREFRHVDWGLYLATARALHDYRATHLGELAVPTLVVAGERDRLTPVVAAEAQTRAIPGAELFVVPRATHYLVSEYPSIVAQRIERFVEGLHDQGPRASA